MKKIIIATLAALVLVFCTACAPTGAAVSPAELDALRAENARLSAELEAVKADTEATAAEAALEPVATLYARTAKITEVDYDTDTVTLVDGAGRLWSFTGCEDYAVDDFVSLLMSDAGTPENCYDDVIVSARYAGFWD